MPLTHRAFHLFCGMLFGFGPSYLPISDLHHGHSVKTSGFPAVGSDRNALTSVLACAILFGDALPPIHRPREKRAPGMGAILCSAGLRRRNSIAEMRLAAR